MENLKNIKLSVYWNHENIKKFCEKLTSIAGAVISGRQNIGTIKLFWVKKNSAKSVKIEL